MKSSVSGCFLAYLNDLEGLSEELVDLLRYLSIFFCGLRNEGLIDLLTVVYVCHYDIYNRHKNKLKDSINAF